MTKEEAIKYLQQLYPNGGHCWLDEQRIEAIGMAVKALQEEPAEIDFEQELYKAFGQVKDFTLGMRIAKWFYDMGKNSQEPVSEEEPTPKVLEDMFNAKSAAESLGISQEEHDKIVDECIYGKEPVNEDLMSAANHAWLKAKDTESYADTFTEGFKAGAKWQKEQTITKACDWLKRNADSYTWYNEFEGESGVTEDFVDEFKKEIQ